MKKLILLLAISVWITQSNAEEATSGNLLPNAGTGQTSLQNSSGSIDGFNSTSNWTMSGTTYYPNEIEATGTGTVSANGSLLNLSLQCRNKFLYSILPTNFILLKFVKFVPLNSDGSLSND